MSAKDSSAKRIAFSIAKHLGAEAGIEVCRGYMIERLRLVTTKDLYEAIRDGTHTMGVAESKDRNFGKKWGRVIERFSYKGDKIRREYLTAENVLEWLRMDRPDLASLIINMNPAGMEWLREDTKQVYTFLFSESKPQPKPVLTLVKRQPEQPKQEMNVQEQASAPTEEKEVAQTSEKNKKT